MRLNDFVDGFLKGKEEEIENPELIREDLEEIYLILDRAGLTKKMTPEKAKIFYEIYKPGYDLGASVCLQDALEILHDM